MRITPLLLLGLALAAVSCRSSDDNDQPVNDGVPSPTGKDLRIRDVQDPTMADHASMLNATKSISGAVVIAVDTYSETGDGKNTGGVYVEDLDSSNSTPFAGINLYNPTYSPGNLHVSPGDVLDMNGEYEESNTLGSTVTFPMGTSLNQVYLPTATFRFETQVPAPIIIDNPDDLNDYAKVSKWIGMLVQVNNPTAFAATFTSGTSGRQTIDMASGRSANCNDPFPKAWQIANDLMDLTPMNVTAGQKFKSITGVLSFFCNVQLYTRSAADFVTN